MDSKWNTKRHIKTAKTLEERLKSILGYIFNRQWKIIQYRGTGYEIMSEWIEARL